MTLKTQVQNRNGNFLVVTQDAGYNAINAVGFESMVHPIDKVTYDANMNKVLDFIHASDRMSAVENHRKLVDKWEGA
jgi:hypothetical protein